MCAEEDNAYATKKQQLKELIRMREELDRKSQEGIKKTANERMIKSPEDFFKRLAEYGKKDLGSIIDFIKDMGGELADIFKLPEFSIPGFENALTPDGMLPGKKNGKGDSLYVGAFEKGSVEAYRVLINNTTEARMLQAQLAIKDSSVRQETLLKTLVEQGEEIALTSGEI